MFAYEPLDQYRHFLLSAAELVMISVGMGIGVVRGCIDSAYGRLKLLQASFHVAMIRYEQGLIDAGERVVEIVFEERR